MPSDDEIKVWRKIFESMWGKAKRESGYPEPRKSRWTAPMDVYSGPDMKLLWENYLNDRRMRYGDAVAKPESSAQSPSLPAPGAKDFFDWMAQSGRKPASPEAMQLFADWASGSGGQYVLDQVFKGARRYSPTANIPGARR